MATSTEDAVAELMLAVWWCPSTEPYFRNNVRGEIWAAHIGQALGLDAHHVEHMVKKTVDGYLEEVRQSGLDGGAPYDHP